jgi:hypothetical protein
VSIPNWKPMQSMLNRRPIISIRTDKEAYLSSSRYTIDAEPPISGVLLDRVQYFQYQ